jgi:hypothetical protein
LSALAKQMSEQKARKVTKEELEGLSRRFTAGPSWETSFGASPGG